MTFFSIARCSIRSSQLPLGGDMPTQHHLQVAIIKNWVSVQQVTIFSPCTPRKIPTSCVPVPTNTHRLLQP